MRTTTNKARPWTPREEYTLRDEYKSKTAEEIGALLGRSTEAVRMKLVRMKLRKPGEKTNKRYTVWTPQMLKTLTDFYPIMFNKALAGWLGVTTTTMRRKAKALGLSKVDGFLDIRRKEISRMSGEAQRGKPKPQLFKKGVRANPGGEFRPGHRESPEVREKRIAAIKAAWKRKKQQSVKYY